MTLFLLALASGAPVIAQAEDPLDPLLAENVHSLDWGDGRPSGPGWALLVREGRAAEFLLVGESHGNRETPQLALALAAALRPAGYEAYAVEVGPVTARDAVALCAEGEGAEPFRTRLEAYPYTFPFFWWKEEAESVCSILDLGYALWGLDQEFIGSARWLLAELRQLVPTGSAAHRVEAWMAEAQAAATAAQESGNLEGLFLQTVDPRELRGFAETLPAEALRAREILEELAASALVYQHYVAERYFENNRDRVRLIKRHFRQAIARDDTSSSPKVLVKLGSVHAGRGRSPMMQLDVGNTAAELAALRGGDSFHLLVVARRSVGADGTEQDWSEMASYIGRLDAQRPDDAWGVFDLRPLRTHFASAKRRDEHPDLADLVFRYDAVLLADRFHAAEALVPLP